MHQPVAGKSGIHLLKQQLFLALNKELTELKDFVYVFNEKAVDFDSIIILF